MNEETKRVLRAILFLNEKPCTIKELSEIYFETEGEKLDFSKLGFASLQKCLLGMPDVCKLQHNGIEWYVDRVSTAETKHMDSMTKPIQKRSKKKRFTSNIYVPRPPRLEIQNRINTTNSHRPRVPSNYFKDTVPKSNTNKNLVVTVKNNTRYIVNSNKCVVNSEKNHLEYLQYPSTKSQKCYSYQTVLKRNPSSVNAKPIQKPVISASKSNFVFKRNVPTLVLKDTFNCDSNICSFTKNDEDEIKMQSYTPRSKIEIQDNSHHWQKSGILNSTSVTPNLKSDIIRSSMENINSKSKPSYALMKNALNEIKIQKKQDCKKYDTYITKLKLNDETHTVISGQMKVTELSDLDKEIFLLLPDDPIYLIEFPEIIQDCTFKIPSAKIGKTKADLNFELYISEVHSPSQFWFQYGEDLEDLMSYIKEFYSELKMDDLSISAINAKPGLIVVAFLFSKWQRAEILSEVDESNKLRVFFFDYGTRAEIDLKNVKYLLKFFSKIPRNAFRGCLHGIKPKNGDETFKIKSSLVFLEKIEDKRLFGKVVNHREEENVFELIVKESMNDRYSLSDTLIAEGYADPAPSSKLINGVLLYSIGPKCSYHPSYDMLEQRYYPTLTERIFLELKGIDLNILEELNFFQNLNSYAAFICNPAIIEMLNHENNKLIKNHFH